jgi:hypothetical protein
MLLVELQTCGSQKDIHILHTLPKRKGFNRKIQKIKRPSDILNFRKSFKATNPYGRK